jgi:hypothetical protein
MLDITVEPEGGEAAKVDITNIVLSLAFSDEEAKADKLSISVINEDGSAWDTGVFAKGNYLIVSWGYSGAMSPPRKMVITKSFGGRTLTVEAKDVSILMHRETKSETYEGMTRSDVARLIAARNGFGVDLQDIEDTAEVHETIVQPNISDIRMLHVLAHKQGFECYVGADGTLHWHARRLDSAPVRTFVYRPAGQRDIDVDDRNLIEDYNVENDLTAKPAKTKLEGLDPKTKQPISVVASDTETERPALSQTVEIRDFETGEWRKVTRTAIEEVRPTQEVTQEAAKTRADARFKKVSLTAVKLKLDVLGDPLLLAKTVVDVRGIAKRIDGRYYVKKVDHRIDSGGYKCTAELVTDGTGGGVDINDILFPPPESPANDAGGGAVSGATLLEDARRRLAAQGTLFTQISDGAQVNLSGVQALDRELADLARRMQENPNDAEAFQRARDVGRTLRTTVPGLEGLGHAVEQAGNLGGVQATSRSKAKVNQHPPAEQRDREKLAEDDWLDEEEKETREWYDEDR